MSLPEPPLNASRVPPVDPRVTGAEVRASPELGRRTAATLMVYQQVVVSVFHGVDVANRHGRNCDR